MKGQKENKNKRSSGTKKLEGGLEVRAKETHVALLNILEDVEEARARAVEEKNKTLAIITNFTDGLLFFDKKDKLSLVNPVAEDFLNIKATDIVGKSFSKLANFPKLKAFGGLLKKAAKRIFKEEIELEKELILEVSTVPIMREKEKLGLLVILHDITREKLVEKMKTEFVSLAAHQLRTPLSAIKWTLKMVLDGDLGRITKEQTEFLEKTYNSNERMINLINDLLNVTRIEEGRYLYKPVLAQFEDLVEEVANNYKGEIKRRNIKFWLEKPKEKMPKMKMDMEKMKLAVSNLLDNAIRYTLSGGKVRVSLKYEEKKIKFSVEDSGIGVSKDQQKRLFTKFFRGANAIRTETEGSGLGLFIAKNIIEAHGGNVWFESEEDKGSVFGFDLPTGGKLKEFLKSS